MAKNIGRRLRKVKVYKDGEFDFSGYFHEWLCDGVGEWHVVGVVEMSDGSVDVVSHCNIVFELRTDEQIIEDGNIGDWDPSERRLV